MKSKSFVFASLLSLFLAFVFIFQLTYVPVSFARAEESPVSPTATRAILNYTPNDSIPEGDSEKVVATAAEITGAGTYTVSVDLSKTKNKRWKGLRELSIEVEEGTKDYSGYNLRVWSVTVNGSPVSGLTKSFTYDDDGSIFGALHLEEAERENARTYDGIFSDARWSIFTEEHLAVNFKNVMSISVEFSFVAAEHSADLAYLMFCDNKFSYPYNALPDEEVTDLKSYTQYVTGPGEYKVGLEFTSEKYKPETAKFISLNILDGQTTFPSYFIKLKSLRVNDRELTVGKGYTCDMTTTDADGINGRDGIRYYLFHGWLDEVETAGYPRCYGEELEGATPRIVQEDDFVTMTGSGGDAYLSFSEPIASIEVEFELIERAGEKVTAHLEFVDKDFEEIYYGEGNEFNTDGIVVKTATVDRAKTYAISLDFTGTEQGYASGLTVLGVVLTDGERKFEGYNIRIREVYVNGQLIDFLTENDAPVKSVTYPYGSADDTSTPYDLRYDIYTQFWQSLPVGARSWDRQTRGAKNITVNDEDFAHAETITVVFDFLYGNLADSKFDPSEYLGQTYHAYLNLSTENYIFRNEWYESDYGLNGTYADRFYKLTGWDQSKDDDPTATTEERWVDYGGTFTDTVIDGNGRFTVSLKLDADKGFGNDSSFRVLNVNTDIPSQLYDDGYVDFTNVVTCLDSQLEKTYFYVYTEKEYVNIVILSEYVAAVGRDSISYTMPTDSISISFTISGLEKESGGSNTPGPENPGTDKPGTDKPGTEEPGTEEPAKKGCRGVIGLSAAPIVLILSLAAVFTVKRGKKN